MHQTQERGSLNGLAESKIEVVADRLRKTTDRVPTPIAYRPADAAFVLGVCRATIYEMLADGRLEGRKLGTATVIPHASMVEALEKAPFSEATTRARARLDRRT